MDAITASLPVRAGACLVRTAGMQAENQHRLDCGNSIAYGADAFEHEAATMEHIAAALLERAG